MQPQGPQFVRALHTRRLSCLQLAALTDTVNQVLMGTDRQACAQAYARGLLSWRQCILLQASSPGRMSFCPAGCPL